MNRGTNQNIITQLGMTADEYNLITVVYYVSDLQKRQHSKLPLIKRTGPVHCRRGAI